MAENEAENEAEKVEDSRAFSNSYSERMGALMRHTRDRVIG